MQFLTQSLNRPLPFLHQKRFLIFWLIEIWVLGTLFEYLIEPFARNYDEHIYTYWIICVFHASVAVTAYALTFWLIHVTHRKSSWRIKDELKYALVLLLLVGLGAFLIRDLIYDEDNWRWDLLWTEMNHGFLAGALFYSVIFNINRYIVQMISRIDESVSLVKIESAVSSDSFEVDPKQIICIKADGNYAVFYLSDQDESNQQLIRQTLDNLEKQLAHYPQFIRTHRAYIVNQTYLMRYSGNSAGLQLTMEKLDFKIPVSRSNVKRFEASQGMI